MNFICLVGIENLYNPFPKLETTFEVSKSSKQLPYGSFHKLRLHFLTMYIPSLHFYVVNYTFFWPTHPKSKPNLWNLPMAKYSSRLCQRFSKWRMLKKLWNKHVQRLNFLIEQAWKLSAIKGEWKSILIKFDQVWSILDRSDQKKSKIEQHLLSFL